MHLFIYALLLFLPLLLLPAMEKQEVEERVRHFCEQHALEGVAVGVIGFEEHQKCEALFTHGHLSLKSLIPINPYAELRIGPLTELFTAALLASFVKEGALSLSDPIAKFLPKSQLLPTYEGVSITLGDLATHTSGLPDMPHLLSSRSTFTLNQMQRFLSHYQLTRKPGERYEHSSFGYALLSNLLSRFAKRSFFQLCEERLFAPLRLKETTFTLSQEQKGRVVTGYEQGRAISPFFNGRLYSPFIGAEGLYSTPNEMLTFLSFNMGKQKTALSAILPMMQRSYHTFKNFEVGLGWKITRLEEELPLLYSLGGRYLGFNAYMGIIPEREVGVVLLSNQGESNMSHLGESLLLYMVEQE